MLLDSLFLFYVTGHNRRAWIKHWKCGYGNARDMQKGKVAPGFESVFFLTTQCFFLDGMFVDNFLKWRWPSFSGSASLNRLRQESYFCSLLLVMKFAIVAGDCIKGWYCYSWWCGRKDFYWGKMWTGLYCHDELVMWTGRLLVYCLAFSSFYFFY